MPQDPNAPRERLTWQRGKQAEFRIKLLNKDASPMALDTTKYPAFAIYAPSGTMFQQGVMQQFAVPGQYRTLWTIPTNAELSNDRGTWTFEITAIRSKDLKQVQKTMDFNVIEKRTTSSDNRNVVQLAVAGMPYRALWRGDYDPDELTLQMFYSTAPEDPSLAPVFIPITKAAFTQVTDGDSIAYYYDVPASSITVSGDYTLLWTIRETATAPLENDYEQLRVIKKSFIRHIPSLRFACERLPMDPNAPQKISDADLVEALTQAAAMLNMYHPISTYSPETIPGTLHMHWMLLAIRWMLTSQHLVLSAQSFNFSGQSVSLDFDQTGAVESAIGRIDGYIDNSIKEAKLATNRALTSNLALGLRSNKPIGWNQRVIRYEHADGSGNYGMILGQLTTLGLIP
jgi:hypothetical protein